MSAYYTLRYLNFSTVLIIVMIIKDKRDKRVRNYAWKDSRKPYDKQTTVLILHTHQ